MQIIAGAWRGRKLLPLEGAEIRPTSARAREAIFNLLMHRRDAQGASYIVGQTVADFCCGSGAMGLEALSRGATHAIFVDARRASLEIARANAEKLGANEISSFITADVLQLPPAAYPCRVVFCDPPYEMQQAERILGSIQAQGWLQAGGLVVLEQAEKSAVPEAPGFTLLAEKHYGRARVMVWEFQQTEEEKP